jgi:hypothetical protein
LALNRKVKKRLEEKFLGQAIGEIELECRLEGKFGGGDVEF